MNDSAHPNDRPRKLWRSRGIDSLLILLLFVLGLAWSLKRLSGERGIVEIGDDEVAVVYNNLSGTTRQVETPGNELFLPFIEQVRLLKRSPVELWMKGEERTGAVQVPELRLRATDGTAFRFESFAVQYALRPDAARERLEDSGEVPEDAAAIVEAWVRAILRDEYGGFTTEEVVMRENQKSANAASLARLNQALILHGLEIQEISTPKVRFDSAYEKAVENRKIANQEVERLKAEFRHIDAERDQKFAALETEMEIKRAELKLKVMNYVAVIEKDARTRRAEADRYLANRRGAGDVSRYQKQQESLAMSETYDAQAGALRDEVAGLAEGGEAMIREAWIERLDGIEFRSLPYSRDARPAAVEILDAGIAGNLGLAGNY